MIDYTLVRSKRKTIALSVTKDATLIVRAPKLAPKFLIENFVKQKSKWIEKQQSKMESRRVVISKRKESLSDPERKKFEKIYREQAREKITERCKYYGEMHGLKFNRIRITGAKTRWGSCSAKNNLNFCWKLILAPEEILDYVVVHELSHTVHKNHSAKFWNLVEQIDPEHKKNRKWLKQNGWGLEI